MTQGCWAELLKGKREARLNVCSDLSSNQRSRRCIVCRNRGLRTGEQLPVFKDFREEFELKGLFDSSQGSFKMTLCTGT